MNWNDDNDVAKFWAFVWILWAVSLFYIAIKYFNLL